MAPSLSVADLLISFSREEYEKDPFAMLLFTPGTEAERWDRPFSDRVWNFDPECVEDTGAYLRISRNLSRVARTPDALANLRDHVDHDIGEAWIEYTAGQRRQRWTIEIQDDWAFANLVRDLASGGAARRAAREWMCQRCGRRGQLGGGGGRGSAHRPGRTDRSRRLSGRSVRHSYVRPVP